MAASEAHLAIANLISLKTGKPIEGLSIDPESTGEEIFGAFVSGGVQCAYRLTSMGEDWKVEVAEPADG